MSYRGVLSKCGGPWIPENERPFCRIIFFKRCWQIQFEPQNIWSSCGRTSRMHISRQIGNTLIRFEFACQHIIRRTPFRVEPGQKKHVSIGPSHILQPINRHRPLTDFFGHNGLFLSILSNKIDLMIVHHFHAVICQCL